ncbi:MAG: cobalamin-dependent protein [Marmoricola sp.]
MRTELSAEIGRVRDAVADRATDTFLSRHPDWIERYGDRATVHGVQDARHHIDFLQAAVELDDPATFRDYALWCRDLLEPRGISVGFLVENLEAIREDLIGRLSTPAAEAVDGAMRGGLEALAAGEVATPAQGDALSSACRLYVAASVGGHREEALKIVREAVNGGASPVDVYIDIFQSALYEIGRRWQTTGLTIAEEHMATATTQFILSVLHEEHPRAGSHGRSAVVTGVAEDHHVVGANIVANVLDAEGWDVRLLGQDLSGGDIVSVIGQDQASLVAISVTMSDCVPAARDLIALIRERILKTPRIIVGGAAFLRDPQLWRIVGADGFATDARSVAELARGG